MYKSFIYNLFYILPRHMPRYLIGHWFHVPNKPGQADGQMEGLTLNGLNGGEEN